MRSGIARTCAALVLLGTTGSFPPRSEAQAKPPDAREDRDDREARVWFEAGRMAMENGRYEEALEAFERAYRLSDRPGLLFNIGSVAERLRRDGEAISAYERYLERVPDAPNRKDVERRIALLRPSETERELPSPTRDMVAPASAPTFSTEGPEARDTPLTRRWWFWTGIAAGVAVVSVTAFFLASTPRERHEAPLPGTNGAVISTLSWR